MHLIGVHLIGVHLMNVPLSWASLAGLSRGPLCIRPEPVFSASAPEPVSSASAPEPVSSTSAPEPVSSTPAPEPPSPAPVPTPEPRRSKRTLSIPGHYAVLAGRSPRKPRRGGNCSSRATWIQLWVSCHGQSCNARPD